MLFWVICTCILLCICILLFFLLLKDNGIIGGYFIKARDMAAKDGWFRVFHRAVLMILGKAKQFVPGKKFKMTDGQYVTIAFYPTGGMGDYIISSKLVEELQEYAFCKITVFCEKIMFGEAIYGGRNGITLEKYSGFEINRNSFDLALKVEHFVHVLNMDDQRLKVLAPQLYQRMKYIVDHWDELYINIPEQCYRERIQFERCRLLGLNRWTELRMGQAFKITNQKTVIPLNPEYEDEWKKLGLNVKGYITINRCADQMRKGMEQIKLWPKEYYEEFINLWKAQYPQMPIIQLGDSECEALSGVGRAILGQSLELTKWILKNSFCHIDCEGGLVHLATQLETKCIVIFGPTPVHMYGYEQNINLVSRLCNNCMGLHDEWAYRCYRKDQKNRCMCSIAPQTVINAI